MTTTSKAIQKGNRESRVSRPPRSAGTCKTCTPCRQKKVKCDGTKPHCLECSTGGLNCVYPHDARREPRPSKARVQSLEATVMAMLEHMKTSGIIPPNMQPGDWMPRENGSVDSDNAGTFAIRDFEDMRTHLSQDGSLGHLASTAAVASPLPTPSTSASEASKRGLPSYFLSPMASANISSSEYPHEYSGAIPVQNADIQPEVVLSQSFPEHALPPTPTDIASRPEVQSQEQTQTPSTGIAKGNDATAAADTGGVSGMSPCEARVAGAFHEHGCVSSVHGLASIMNPVSRAQHKENISKMTWKGDSAIAASKARLISNAALQRQREPRIFRQPANFVDLDGCAPELAKHLLDLHFNRQHYAYLVSYRPAITESLVNGGGPWMNKLLLNAIYYSSTLYSDRQGLRSDPDDPNSTGSHFYRRFRHLLADEIDKPSIPSAQALLLTSATLVSHGRSSAGWNLSGTAYRMIIDMGCHLMLGPDYQSMSKAGHGQLFRRDLEQEMRKRLYWGAFVTDATQSLYLGRPCMFAAAEARVPLSFLDTFEELEEWEPYIDPLSPAEPPPAYAPQAAHAVSTFSWLARLFQISTRITDLYGLQAIKCSSEYLQDKKASIEKDLDYWSTSLPAHLRFDPDGPLTPPPHQITPHTTLHALTILLHRAFLEEGHLHRHCDEGGRRRSEEACITSALAIQKLVRAYKRAFTLRRAPFLLSYAIYSAVIVILRQERHERGQFMEPISFFWTCLSELQHGCNLGLQKPLNILRDMVHEFQVSTREGGAGEYELPQISGLNETLFSLPMNQGQQTMEADSLNTPMAGEQSLSPDYMGIMNQPDLGFGTSSPGFLASLNQLENDISQDTLYGLFAPPQLFQ